METKHTQGPWEVFQGGNFLMVIKTGMGKVKGFDKSNRIICEIRTELSCFEGTDEDKANARLIAAAPDLLDACKYTYLLLTQNIGQQTHAIAFLRTAISKAG